MANSTPTLTDGAWNNASLDNGEICFVVENDTRYTVQDVSILLTFDPKPAEASEQTIMAIAGHVSPKMLAHYSHVRLEAKRKALDALAKTKQGRGI